MSPAIPLGVTFFGLSTQVSSPSAPITFFGFLLQCLPEKLIRINLWLKHYLGDLNWFNSWPNQLSRELTQNQLTTQADSPGIDSDRLMAQAASLGIKSNWLMAKNASPLFDPNRLMTEAKNIWFRVDSWFDSESYPCLVGSIGQAQFCEDYWTKNTKFGLPSITGLEFLLVTQSAVAEMKYILYSISLRSSK